MYMYKLFAVTVITLKPKIFKKIWVERDLSLKILIY